MIVQNNQALLSLCYEDVNYHNLVIRNKSEVRKNSYKQKNKYFYVLKNLDTGSFIAEIFTSFYDKTDFWARINIFLNLQLVDIYFHHQYDGQFLTS